MSVRTIALLPALTGAWRDVGGGVQLSTSQAFHLNQTRRRDARTAARFAPRSRGPHPQYVGTRRRVSPKSDDPPSKRWSSTTRTPPPSRPIRTPSAAVLRRDDLFTVVLEQFQTDTADFADIVLPATTFLEHTDLYLAYGHYHLQLARPALAAPGEALPNTEIFRRPGCRHGFLTTLLPRYRRRHDPHAARHRAIRSSPASRWSSSIASTPCA